MAELSNIVEVYISRETTQIDTASFDKPLFLVELPDTVDNTDPMNPVYTPADVTQRVRAYTSLTSVGTDLGINSAAYRMVAKAFSGDQRPSTVYIGVKNTTETYAQGVQAVLAASNEWYILAIDSKSATNISAVAEIIQATRKMFFASTADAAVINPTSTTDVGYTLSNSNYDRTVLVYHPDAVTAHPECAWLGSQIVEVPGSNTWAFKKGAGLATTSLSETAVQALKAKNVNYFISIAGASVFLDGVTSQGEWIDTMIFVDWMYARIQEQVFYRIINKKKIPMTQAGATIIGAEIRSVISQGVANGGIADTPAPRVIEPNVLAIPEIQRGQRIMGDFKFEARLAGAVHKVVIRGTVGY